MRLLWGDDENVAAWVAARIPHMAGEGFGACVAVGVLSQAGVPLAGVVFTNYRPQTRDIEMSFAADSRRWLTRGLITGIMRYPFVQLDCQRVTGFTPKRAKAARAFLDAFGFKREGVARRGFGNDDAIISGLLRSEWDASRFNLERVRLQGQAGLNHPATAPILTA